VTKLGGFPQCCELCNQIYKKFEVFFTKVCKAVLISVKFWFVKDAYGVGRR
jgi:hypothetical protein